MCYLPLYMCYKRICSLLITLIFLINIISAQHVCNLRVSKNIEYSIQDNNFGIMDVNLSVHHNRNSNCNNYMIYLYVYENIQNETDCKVTSFNINRVYQYFHTENKINDINDCENVERDTTCDLTHHMKYKFVFTGCYQILTHTIPDSTEQDYTNAFWVNSTYEKRKIIDTRPVYTYGGDVDQTENTVTVQFHYTYLDMLLWDNTFYFEVYNESRSELYKESIITGKDYYCAKWNVLDEIVSNNISNNDILITPIKCCHDNDCKNAEQCFFNLEAKTIRCSFIVRKFDNVTAEVRLTNADCCALTSLWKYVNPQCSFTLEPLSQNTDVTTPPPPQSDGITGATLAAPLGALLILVVIFLILYKWFVPGLYVFTNRKRRIFLLYPRDCEEPFPTIIKRFTKLLHSLGNFEIYDIWDEQYFESIALSAPEWVQHKIQESDFVFHIPTKRGEALYERSVSFNGNLQKLREDFCSNGGEAFDHYFPYAYKLSSHQKNKFVNIDFADFTKDIKNDVMKSNGRMYNMPKETKKLCKKLQIYKKNCISNNSNYSAMIDVITEAKFLSSSEDHPTSPLLQCIRLTNNNDTEPDSIP